MRAVAAILAGCAAVLTLTTACTPDEIARLAALDAWVQQAIDNAETTGAPCAEYAGDVAWRGLPDHFLDVIWRESRCDPGAVNADSGALGLTQIMPFWLDALCPAGIACTTDDLLDPATNLDAAAFVYAAQGGDAWSTW